MTRRFQPSAEGVQDLESTDEVYHDRSEFTGSLQMSAAQAAAWDKVTADWALNYEIVGGAVRQRPVLTRNRKRLVDHDI